MLESGRSAVESGRSTVVRELVRGRHLAGCPEGGIERAIRLVAGKRDCFDVCSVTPQAAGSAGHDLAVRLNGDPSESVLSDERRLHDPASTECRIERAVRDVPGESKGYWRLERVDE